MVTDQAEKDARMTIDNVTNKTNDKNRRRRRRRARPEDAEESVEITAGQTARKARPTPSRRERESKSGGNLITRSFRAIGGYLGETRDELQKVTWPSRQDSMRLSGIVLAVTIVFSIGLGILDFLYGELFALGFGGGSNNWLVFVVFAVVVIVVVTLGLRWIRRNS
jgi:preprotein translocase subunit SecE